VSIDQQRVVISKDADFFYSHLLIGRPMETTACENWIEAAFLTHTLVEVDHVKVTPVA
jgi:hypothetical protein